MKRLLIAILLSSAVGAWAAKPESAVKTVTVVPVIKKPKLLRSNPFRAVSIRLTNAIPSTLPEDEDLAIDRRREIQLDQDHELDLGDDIKIKLALARYRALERYRQVWG